MRRHGKKLETWKAPDGRSVEIRITPVGSFTAEVDDQHFANDVKRDLIKTLEDWFDEVKRLDWKPFILWRVDTGGWNETEPKFDFVWSAQQGDVRKFRKGLYPPPLSPSAIADRREMPGIGPDECHGRDTKLIEFTFERWEACLALSRQARSIVRKGKALRNSKDVVMIIDGVASGAVKLCSTLVEVMRDEGDDYSAVVAEIEGSAGESA